MAEMYKMYTRDHADWYRCVAPYTDCMGAVIDHCQPGRCPAWIEEVDNEGKPTGRGRCGMVPAILYRTPA